MGEGRIIVCRDVLPNELRTVWFHALAYIKEGLAAGFGEYSLADIYESLLVEKMRLWIIQDARPFYATSYLGAVLCELRQLPRARVMTILALSGRDLPAWVDQVENIVDWAKQEKADLLTAQTRPGIAKLLKPYGFDSSQVVITRRINGS